MLSPAVNRVAASTEASMPHAIGPSEVPDGAFQSEPGKTDLIAQNLLLFSELKRIEQALRRSGIDSIVLKGLPLTLRLFGRLDGREMIDNDVLVHRRDVPRAVEALIDIGYANMPFCTVEPQLPINFSYALVLKEGGPTAELHWNIVHPLLFDLPEEMVWGHTETFELRDLPVRVLDKPLTLLHLAAHFHQHCFSKPSILRDLGRAWNLWHAEVSGSELLGLARQAGLSHVVDHAFSCADRLGMLESSPPAIASRRTALVHRLLPAEEIRAPRPKHDYWRAMLALLLVAPRKVPGWIRAQVFPPIEKLAEVHQRPVSPGLYFRYFTRPFRPLARMLGKGFGSL
jgi:putative nucleotidyltransferase-like protein